MEYNIDNEKNPIIRANLHKFEELVKCKITAFDKKNGLRIKLDEDGSKWRAMKPGYDDILVASWDNAPVMSVHFNGVNMRFVPEDLGKD